MRKRKPLALAGIGVPAITLFLLTPVFLLALAGCGVDTTEDPQPATNAECTVLTLVDSELGTKATSRECEITLKDTRKLDCVVVSGGLSCDWDHVSGADKEPDR